MKKRTKAKRGRAATTDLYLWHLRAPFADPDSQFSPDLFDRSAWWEDSPQNVPREAAFWELLRRHPRAASLHQPETTPANDLEWFIREHGLSSWPRLAERSASKDHELKKQWECFKEAEKEKRQKDLEREWRRALASLPPQSGFDGRPAISVTLQSVDLGSGANPNAVLVLDEKLRNRAKRHKESRELLRTAEEIRASEVGRFAEEHHREGRIIIAIAPDIGSFEDAKELLSDCYRHHWMPQERGRGHTKTWLKIVHDFELEEERRSPKQIRDSQLFARFRRIVVGVGWPASVTPVA